MKILQCKHCGDWQVEHNGTVYYKPYTGDWTVGAPVCLILGRYGSHELSECNASDEPWPLVIKQLKKFLEK
jgi:hypothetical protein